MIGSHGGSALYVETQGSWTTRLMQSYSSWTVAWQEFGETFNALTQSAWLAATWMESPVGHDVVVPYPPRRPATQSQSSPFSAVVRLASGALGSSAAVDPVDPELPSLSSPPQGARDMRSATADSRVKSRVKSLAITIADKANPSPASWRMVATAVNLCSPLEDR
jgi:hypothetical protein